MLLNSLALKDRLASCSFCVSYFAVTKLGTIADIRQLVVLRQCILIRNDFILEAGQPSGARRSGRISELQYILFRCYIWSSIQPISVVTKLHEDEQEPPYCMTTGLVSEEESWTLRFGLYTFLPFLHV
jgi:hypothetical protein